MKKIRTLKITGRYRLAKNPREERGGSKGRIFKIGVSKAGMMSQLPLILIP